MEIPKRSYNCGELSVQNVGESVHLYGWVYHRRHHGGLFFLDLRDRYGLIQVVFRPENAKLFSEAENLSGEDVIYIKGVVVQRPVDAFNKDLPTGEVEVLAEKLDVLNKSKVPPFQIEDEVKATEEHRLEWRYLDLRRPIMQKGIIQRHKAAQATREYLNKNDFLEIETPILMKSTPEGARDYLVPSRKHKGKFYALPQSPQTYKQLLMISGYDRYYQLARCFRDEDLRADRQPEFTQIDIEMSFVNPEDVMEMAEGLLSHIIFKTRGISLKTPFLKLKYSDALTRYGSDKPDLRIPLEIQDFSDVAKNSGFKIFASCIQNGGVVRGLKIPGGAQLSRSELDQLAKDIECFNAKGLVNFKISGAEISSPILKFLSEGEIAKLREIYKPGDGDIIFMVADSETVVANSLGFLLTHLAERFNLYSKETFTPLWITDMPLLEHSETEDRLMATHHPFTAPVEKDIPLLLENPMAVKAKAYDLVLNGFEIAGGSIRNHKVDVQRKVFEAIKISESEAEEKFGFLLNALQFGAPPHGGIAFGFDRLVMLIAGETSIRNIIPFPKTTTALSLMDGSPTTVKPEQLEELGIKLIKEKGK
ncbi:aspartate--tRNA ligase [bacterium]|nr:aspartate--tRNA ligase [bacterium]